ncbi:unnamed protein product [Plutella xylostella]|uniref:Dipeptidase n=1 Tax=Plutella xylostella TaxID=51655 RepID=A0A8S4G937_PLUXY|nr:unnamed protein product [Plutella xylostella]
MRANSNGGAGGATNRCSQFWSAFVPCGAQNKDAVQLTLEQIDVIQRMVEKYPHHLKLATNVNAAAPAAYSGVTRTNQ